MEASPGTYPQELVEAVQVLEQAGPQAGMTALLAHVMAANGHGLDLITVYKLLGAPRLAPSPAELRRAARPPAASAEALAAVYQLKVTLQGSKPSIWRRVLVTGDTTLAKLHDILQIAFAWEDYHLHQFTIGGVDYGVPDPDYDDWEHVLINEKRIKLAQVITGPKQRFLYTYDFGDGWDHSILVEKVLAADPEGRYPVCTAGRRAAPPEDCGGIWGYHHMLEVLAAGPDGPEEPESEAAEEEAEEWLLSESEDGLDDLRLFAGEIREAPPELVAAFGAMGCEEEEEEGEYEMYREWIGGEWDAELCDLEYINRQLAPLGRKGRRKRQADQ
jgi:hypothetical protein